MAEVDVTIGGRAIRLACDDGQEQRLQALAADFDRRVADAHGKNGQLSDSQAMVVAALAILDEYDEARQRWAGITPEGAAAEWAAARLDRASERLEKALSGS